MYPFCKHYGESVADSTQKWDFCFDLHHFMGKRATFIHFYIHFNIFLKKIKCFLKIFQLFLKIFKRDRSDGQKCGKFREFLGKQR